MSHVRLRPLGADAIRGLSSGRVTTFFGGAFNPRTHEPEKGSLHDPSIFGGPDDGARFGHVELPWTVVHPWWKPLAAEVLGWTDAELAGVLEGTHALVDEAVISGEEADADLDRGPPVAAHALAALDAHPLLAALDVRPSDLCLSIVPVVPRALRRQEVDGVPVESALDHLYLEVLSVASRGARLIELAAPPVILRHESTQLQRAIDRLFDNARTPSPTRWLGDVPLPALGDLLDAHRDAARLDVVLRACAVDVVRR